MEPNGPNVSGPLGCRTLRRKSCSALLGDGLRLMESRHPLMGSVLMANADSVYSTL